MNNSSSRKESEKEKIGQSSRRQFLKSVAGASALVGSGLLSNSVLSGLAYAANQSGSSSPDIVLLNGNIATVDTSDSFAEALATSGNKIMATGSSADIGKLAGPSTKVIDLGGKTVIPGLNDSHLRKGGRKEREIKMRKE